MLDLVEGDGIGWYRYPGIGEGLEKDDDVYDVFEPDYEDYDDAREEVAIRLICTANRNGISLEVQ